MKRHLSMLLAGIALQCAGWPAFAYDADLARTLGADEQGMTGIFVINVSTQAEAEALLATDPAVQAGALVGEIYLLYGSAALRQVTAIHHTISKE